MSGPPPCRASDSFKTRRSRAHYGAGVSLVQQLIAAIRVAMATVVQAQAAIGTARGHGDEAHELIRTATDGTSDPLPGEAMVRLEQAQVRLDEANAELTAGTAALEEYIARGLGGDGASSPAPTSTPAPSTTPAAAEPRRPDRVPPYRSERHKADEIAPYVGHRNHRGTPVAFGRLYDEDGKPLTPVHIAADDGPARDRADDLTEPLRSSPKLLRHIEGHAAARMRDDKRRVAVLYINREPCDYPNGCDRNLRSILPRDYTLYVHQVFRNGGTKIWPYEGTGEALVNPEEFR